VVQFINHLFTRGTREGDSCCAAVGWAQGMADGSPGAADGIPPGGDGGRGLARGEEDALRGSFLQIGQRCVI